MIPGAIAAAPSEVEDLLKAARVDRAGQLDGADEWEQ